ncbi:MAG: NOL1/NOP2/sun family putative RNA methylase [Candidatus Bathyarchaeota archaeon]|nr:NOL1/NOP2/sun family putative RNA methylase [Candidatus Bathyarchaeota archaeon]
MLKEAWKVAIETLSWIEMRRLSEQMALAKTIDQMKIRDNNIIRYAYRLVSETVRRKNLIDEIINRVLKPETIDQLNFGLQSFLRLYVFQTRIVRNWSKIHLKEAEKIAKLGRSILGWKTLRRIEHILGFLLTQEVQIIFDEADELERVAFQTFHPKWFVKYCLDLLGKKQGISFLESNIVSPPDYIRLNTLKNTESEILNKLSADGVELKKIEFLEYAYEVLGTKRPLSKISSFQNGLFYIQDKASCFAAEISNPKPGMNVLDVCSAPGTKTSYLAQLMKNRGNIYSIDYSKRRSSIWRNEMEKMGVKIASQIIADVRTSLPLNVVADLIVLDPPCTSTGVFGKQPSAKWRLTPQSITKMADIQWQMIDNCVDKVKPEGIIVYSTCSITIEENEAIIEKFLKHNPDFFLVKIEPEFGLPGFRGLKKCQRFYPQLHKSNGFFIAKLKRKN